MFTRRFVRPGLILGLVLPLVGICIVVGSCGGSPSSAEAEGTVAAEPVEVVVSAASDLTPVLDEMAPLVLKDTGLVLKTNIGSTGQLMEQIAAGARVDVFLAASSSAIQQLDEKGLLVPGSARQYARGQLVMWIPSDSTVSVASIEDLAGSGIERISLANPDHAPYGVAARESLQSAGLWDQLQPKLVLAENVRQAFQFAQSGNVDVGLVALSLVINSDGHYALVPEELHKPIDQTLALIAGSSHANEAQAFIDFLTGPKGREILEKYGFTLPQE